MSMGGSALVAGDEGERSEDEGRRPKVAFAAGGSKDEDRGSKVEAGAGGGISGESGELSGLADSWGFAGGWDSTEP